MCHIVDVVLLKEVKSDDPWARADDLINPFAMLQDLASLLLIHDDLALLLYSLFVTSHAYYQVHIWE